LYKRQGCKIWKRNVPFGAIGGERKEVQKILDDKCTGCGVCAEKCPTDAITMEVREKVEKL